ncbi:MAG: Rab family GTPase [Candidatus Hodarchaeota archaeon]
MFKILLLGEPSASNYRFAQKFLTRYCSDNMKLSIGVNFYLKTTESNGIRIKLQVWDLDCQCRFRSLIPLYCRGGNAAFILYDITETSIFANLPEWVQLIRKNAGNIPILLIGCKLELEEFRQVSCDDAISLVEKYNLHDCIEISTRTGQNVENIFNTLTHILMEKHVPQEMRVSVLEFKINRYLTLKLQNKRTNIYVKGILFNQCKYLLLNISKDKFQNYENIESIDEAAETLDRSLEGAQCSFEISPETEFWGHCSNLQAWYENDYDTRLLHRNLAFPLLKALTDAGDPRAKIAFKEEIALRLESGYSSVVRYLFDQGYLNYLSIEELRTILRTPNFTANLAKWHPNWRDLLNKLTTIMIVKINKKFHPEMKKKNDE